MSVAGEARGAGGGLAPDTTQRPGAAPVAAGPEVRTGRLELVLVVVLLVALARFVDGTPAWAVAGLVLASTVLAAVALAGRAGRRSRLESALVPAILAAGAAGAIRLVPVGLGLVPALALLAIVVDRAADLELRLVRQPVAASAHDRSRVLLASVVAAFVAFTGAAALVPGGLVPGNGASVAPLAEGWLVTLAALDGAVALLLGYRLSTFRHGRLRDALASALTYGAVIAIAAGAVRAIDLPRLVGPAVLALVLYLWNAVHGTGPARRREPRFVWEVVLLAILGVVVVAWNLQLRG